MSSNGRGAPKTGWAGGYPGMAGGGHPRRPGAKGPAFGEWVFSDFPGRALEPLRRESRRMNQMVRRESGRFIIYCKNRALIWMGLPITMNILHFIIVLRLLKPDRSADKGTVMVFVRFRPRQPRARMLVGVARHLVGSRTAQPNDRPSASVGIEAAGPRGPAHRAARTPYRSVALNMIPWQINWYSL